MDQSLFQKVPLVERSFFQKLLGQQPVENSVIELNNLLASKAIKEISINNILEIEREYNVVFVNDFSLNLEEFYATYLNYCLQYQKIGNEKLENLNHLKQLLSLDDGTVTKLRNKVSEVIYRKFYWESIADGEISNEEEVKLRKLETDLNLSEETIDIISSESRKQFMDTQLKKIISNGRISPEEWDVFTRTAKNLKVQITIDDETQAQLEKLKIYWLIENSELPVKTVAINLQKSEVCYYSDNADWLENRTVTQRINYGGIGSRIKITKGVYYRAGTVKVQKITSEQLLQIDRGSLYITNKRIIFIGSKKNTNIQLSKVLSITPYSDGVGIEKDTGKSPILRVSANADLLAMTLGRIINDLQT